MKIGHYMNDFPKMVPARNWNPQEPKQPTIALHCPKNAQGEAQLVWPGMVLCIDNNGTDGETWTVPTLADTVTNTVAGSAAGTTPTVVAIAQDPTFGSQSLNVVMADSLVGLPCTGNFRIVTPFYKRGVAYTPGLALTFATAADMEGDSFESANGLPLHGAVKPAAAGDVVIGYVVRTHSPEFYEHTVPAAGDQPAVTTGITNYDDYSGASTNAVDRALALRKSIDLAEDSLTKPENAYVIEFDTAFQPTK